MAGILDTIAIETKGKSFKTRKYGLDGIEVPRFDYDESKEIKWKRVGETAADTRPKKLKELADNRIKNKTLLHYFLDGSRRVYKVDDMAYNHRIFPVMAGQVGVGCCERIDNVVKPLYYKSKPMFMRELVLALPGQAKSHSYDDDAYAFEYLRKKVNANKILQDRFLSMTGILSYKTKVEPGDKLENKGIATIQNYMVEREKDLVADLAKNNLLFPKKYLVKDGTLEYRVRDFKSSRELEHFRNNYRYVIGVSKSFNPEKCFDKNGNNNSDVIADLPLYCRTPVNMYSSERIGDMYFAVWYVRIRDRKNTINAFDGIIKLEKILVTENEQKYGLDTEEVDCLTADIINERNPVCYGSDRRWANHIYPIYVTERFVKSRYLGESMFLNLF